MFAKVICNCNDYMLNVITTSLVHVSGIAKPRPTRASASTLALANYSRNNLRMIGTTFFVEIATSTKAVVLALNLKAQVMAITFS